MPSVLITGTGTGIGHATAELFAERGWKVYAGSRKPEAVVFHHTGIIPIKLDAGSEKDIRRFFDDLRSKKEALDCVVNNAGFGAVLPFEDTPSELIEEMYRVNVFGLMTICRESCRMMRERGCGTIINISSMVGTMGYPWYAAYVSTKWAVEGLSETLWHEMKPFGVRVELIEPGRVATEFHARSYAEEYEKSVSDVYRAHYDMKVASHRQNFGKTGDAATAEDVAAMIYRAATDGSDRLRYTVGKDAQWVTFWRRVLPERLFLRGISRK